MTQSTPTNSHTVNMNTLVLIEAAHWYAVRGRQFDQGCCFLSSQTHSVSEGQSSFSIAKWWHWQDMAWWLSLHRNVCLTLVLRLCFIFSLSFFISYILCPLSSGLLDLNEMNERNSSISQDGAMTNFSPFLLWWTQVVPLGQDFSPRHCWHFGLDKCWLWGAASVSSTHYVPVAPPPPVIVTKNVSCGAKLALLEHQLLSVLYVK